MSGNPTHNIKRTTFRLVENVTNSRKIWYFASFMVLAGAVYAGFMEINSLATKPVANSEQKTPNYEQPVDALAEVDEPSYRLNSASNWHILGLKEKEIEASDISDLPETALNLELEGTFTSSDKDLASAIITVENKDSKRIYINSEITDGVSLHAVLDDEVVLRRGTTLESLKLYVPVEHTFQSRRRSRTIHAENTVPIVEPESIIDSGDQYQNTVDEQQKVIQKLKELMGQT